MNRNSIAGVFLLLVGVAFGIAGYERAQPTGVEKTLEFAASVSGRQVPSALRRDKSDAYLMVLAGAALFAAGVGLLVRRPSARQQ